MTIISPFTIDIPQASLDDLRDRLDRTRFAPDLPGVCWTQGTPTGFLRDLVAYWKDEYDWRAWESRLNAWPQLISEVDGQPIHFLHIRSAVEGATPLLLLHGWPGSFLEFIHLITPLTDPGAHGGEEADAFHLVIPSHPGSGFSGPTHASGWNTGRMGRAMAALMAELGYDRYLVQGGDVGQFIASDVARASSEHVIGIHLNAATYGFIPWGEVSEDELPSFSEVEQERLARLKRWYEHGSGYFHLQANRPQTLAAGLSDSPAGQLAWIVDMFKEWAQGGPGNDGLTIDRDLVLTNVMLYWLNNVSASSARNYWENMHDGEWPQPVTVPTAVAVFAEDVAIRRFGDQGYNIVRWTEFERGGHFAALEAPDLLLDDIRAFARDLR